MPAGKTVLVVPVPKFSVKIGSPEFPLQNPNCALLFFEEKKTHKTMIQLRMFK